MNNWNSLADFIYMNGQVTTFGAHTAHLCSVFCLSFTA